MIKVSKLLQGAIAATLLPLVAWAGLATQNVVRVTPVSSDGTPNSFSFTDQTNVAVSSTITSSAVTITGINTSITCSATSGTIDKNSVGTFASSQSIANNDTIRARHTSSASNTTTVNTAVDCGGVADTFSSTTEAGGGGGEVVGAWSAFDVYDQQVYRLSDTAPIPAWQIEGATVTTVAGVGWDGGSVNKITPLVTGTAPNTGQGNAGLGQFPMPDDLAITKLNMRWEQYFGPNWITEMGDMIKWAILFSATTPSGEPSDERPMLYLSDMDTSAGDAPPALQLNTLMAIGVASGTVKNFEPIPPNAGYNWPRGNEDFYFGPSATTISGKRVVPASAWYTFELEMLSQPSGSFTNGLIRLVVTNRAGETLTDLSIPWNWDGSWVPNKYLTGVDIMGGGYMNSVSSPSANNYTYVQGLTFAANRPGLIGPRSGFVE